jgi:hypothetical protein
MQVGHDFPADTPHVRRDTRHVQREVPDDPGEVSNVPTTGRIIWQCLPCLSPSARLPTAWCRTPRPQLSGRSETSSLRETSHVCQETLQVLQEVGQVPQEVGRVPQAVCQVRQKMVKVRQVTFTGTLG